MALQYSPRIVTDNLVMCLDASQNKSYPTTDLPVKIGLGLWLDASDDSTFSYSSGTSVSQWRDKSGNNFHATQALSANQPSRNTTQNSRKTVTFDGTNDTVTIPNFVCNSEISIFVVSNCGTTLLIEHSTDTNNNQGFYFYGGGTGMIYITRSTGSIISNTNWLSGGYNIASAVNSTGLDLLTYKNGTQQTIISDGRSSLTNSFVTNTLFIGSRGANSLWSSGPIAEIIIYNRKVSDTERNLIHTYLGQKWGISNTDRRIIDLSGNNHGLLGNGTTADMPLFDFYNKGALKLDGSTDYVSVENNTSLNPTTVTVSLWLKRNNYQSGITNFIRRNDFDSYALMATNNTDTVWFRIRNSVPAVVDAQTSMPLNTWTNLVGTFDGSNVRIYKDGVLANTASNTSPISYSASNTTMIIGRDDAVSGRYAPVSYGSILIYNRALSALEIRQNYEAQKSKFIHTLVQQGMTLSLDAGNPYSYAGAGFDWYDVSGNSYICTLINGPTYNNGAIVFDATNDFVDLTYPYSVPIAASGNAVRSMFAWVRTTSTGNQAFISTGTAASSQSFNLVKYGSYIGVMGYNNDYYPSTGNAGILITDGVWHYIGVTFDGTNLRMYVDGILDNTSGTLTYSTTGQNNFIGKSSHTGNENYTNGSMGMVHVYNRALSGAEVLQNYNATKGRFGR